MLDAGTDIVNIVTADGAGNVPADTDPTDDVVQSKDAEHREERPVTGGTADSTSDVSPTLLVDQHRQYGDRRYRADG